LLVSCSYGEYESFSDYQEAFKKQGERTYSLEDYSKIYVLGNCDLIVDPDASFDIKISGSERALSKILPIVMDGELTIVDSSEAPSNMPTRIIITNDMINKIKFYGRDLQVKLGTQDSISVYFRGENGALFSNASYAEIDCIGSFKCLGRSDELNLKASQGCAADFSQFDAGVATVLLKGEGMVKLLVSDYLDARVRGGGIIKYSGDPKISKSILGSGEITPF